MQGSEGQVPAAIDWCRHYGLLGVLPHGAYRIQGLPFPSRHAVGSRYLFPEWEWLGGEWQWISGSPYRVPKVYFRDQVYTAFDKGFDSRWPVSMPKVVAAFFPGVQTRTFDCPAPHSKEFWAVYSEPVEAIQFWAIAFASTCRRLYEQKHPRRATGLWSYLAPLTITISCNSDGRLVESWNSPSLLCTFARMALQDAMAGYTLQSCESCGTPFVRQNPRALYCSPTCGFRFRKRRARSLTASSSQEDSENGKKAWK